ncbi:hypothetical protein AYI68_g3480 [Smittium mucronatum]|uniref:Uncharacterized protein n=1 Tax=Smittium mucronatum TaxID=133383 RepID=A0A1R0GZS9_9FUNG|nr:hypothetical protein AYI68_g3480 [Smittium mucronatum]
MNTISPKEIAPCDPDDLIVDTFEEVIGLEVNEDSSKYPKKDSRFFSDSSDDNRSNINRNNLKKSQRLKYSSESDFEENVSSPLNRSNQYNNRNGLVNSSSRRKVLSTYKESSNSDSDPLISDQDGSFAASDDYLQSSSEPASPENTSDEDYGKPKKSTKKSISRNG